MSHTDPTTDAVDVLSAAETITVLTGAGMSAESGVPTFRDVQTGLWAKYDPMTLATPEAWQEDPSLVTLLKLIPGAGTAKSVEQIVRIIQDIYTTVEFILEQVKKSIRAVEEFLRFVQDPLGYAGDQAKAKIEAKIAPFKKNLDDAKQTAQNTQDFVTAADVSRARDAPKDRYEAGPGATPWEDAP